MREHVCPGTNDWEGCIDGRWYVPCGHENCTGWCEDDGDCRCECHASP